MQRRLMATSRPWSEDEWVRRAETDDVQWAGVATEKSYDWSRSRGSELLRKAPACFPKAELDCPTPDSWSRPSTATRGVRGRVVMAERPAGRGVTI